MKSSRQLLGSGIAINLTVGLLVFTGYLSSGAAMTIWIVGLVLIANSSRQRRSDD